MLKDIKHLKVNLPEDIQNLKSNGNYDLALKLINMKLDNDITYSLRKRLELEKEILDVLQDEYIYSFDEALKLLQDNINDFKEEELIDLKERYIADWILKNGEVYFLDSFYSNIILTQPDIAVRLKHIEDDKINNLKQKLLDNNVIKMKVNGGVSYKFHLRVTLKVDEKSVVPENIIKVHLPIPNNADQVKNVRIINTTPKVKIIAPFDYEQRTVYFEEVISENQEFTVEYSYEVHLKYNDLDKEKVSSVQPNFYTSELDPHIIFSPYIKDLLDEIIGDEQNQLIKARKIYNFITTKVAYSYVRKYFTILNIPEYAAINMKGDCGIQALLFITLCRCAGIPAKWQSGLYVTPYHVGAHDWAQFYIAPYGWLFADLSFGGSAYKKGKLDRWDFYFGNLDPFRMPANSEFQYEFYPPKKYLRHDPYDNQYGECEYEHRGLRREEYVTKNELISMSEIPFDIDYK